VDRLLDATYRAERVHFWFRGLVEFSEPLIRQAIAGVADPRILDCGCGTGRNMQRLAAYGRVTGFDISWAGLQFARSYAQRHLAQATIGHIPFRDASFDLVTAFDVLACLDEQAERAALDELLRVLRPGGALLINTAALRFLRGQHAVFGSEVRRTTQPLLRNALERSGFQVERLTYTNFSLIPMVVPVRLFQRIIGLATPEETGADIVTPPAPINAALSALVAIESKALRYVNMPIGSSLLALARRPTRDEEDLRRRDAGTQGNKVPDFAPPPREANKTHDYKSSGPRLGS
jgi:SAM-dependent methyltransferase